MIKRLFKTFLKVLVILTVVLSFLAYASPVKEVKNYGITFSAFYAERFGFDSGDVYISMLDDLGVKNIRLPVYWKNVEREDNKFDFSEIDWQLDEAYKREVSVILAVGRKLPRWPECHDPEWIKGLTDEERKNSLLDYVRTTILRYRDHPAVSIWQIENEPFLPFGECDMYDKSLIDDEILIAKTLDNRPVLVTDSGELSLWIPAARRGDIFGTTMYRTVWSDRFGHITYPIPPSFFRVKKTITELFSGRKPMIVIELQGESWQKKMTYEVSVEEQYVSMNPEKFRETIEYAKKSGFDTFYLWGVEWWYWLKENGHQEIWDYVRAEIKNTNNSI